MVSQFSYEFHFSFFYFTASVTYFLSPCSPHRLYDKEGQGFISTDTLRGLISELLAPLTEEELEGILEELDEDGSGSMDFDEFCEMMMTKPED